jgi:hypothetical protein
MVTTPSARIGLLYDSPDDGIDPMVPNFTRLDKVMPLLWVADGVTPTDLELYDGAIVGEMTSGKVWVAKKNVGGTFDKRWIRYPYLFSASSTGPFGTVTAVPYAGGFLTYDTGPNLVVNSTISQLVSQHWVCPQTGIYNIKLGSSWAVSAVGIRALILELNGASTGRVELEDKQQGSASGNRCQVNALLKLTIGDTIATLNTQTSGGALNLEYVSIQVSMNVPTI